MSGCVLIVIESRNDVGEGAVPYLSVDEALAISRDVGELHCDIFLCKFTGILGSS